MGNHYGPHHNSLCFKQRFCAGSQDHETTIFSISSESAPLTSLALTLGGRATQTAIGQVDGTGIDLYSATNTGTYPLEVNADWGNHASWGTGSRYCAAIKGNVVFGTAPGGDNTSCIGVLGMLNTNTVGLRGGDKYGVRGHLDFWGASTQTGTNYNVGALSAFVEHEGTTTISSGAYLCGICIYQVGNPTVSAGGYNPAIWIRANAEASAWQYGLYIPSETADVPIQVGALSSDSQTGHHLNATNPVAVSICTDDDNTTLGSEVYRTILGRTMLFKDAAGCTIISSRGQLKAADAVDFATGVFAGQQGYIELVGDTTVNSGGKLWGVDSCTEVNTSKTLTVASGGIVGGFHAELTGAGSVSATGVMAGLYVDSSAATAVWPYGIYIGASDCTTGAYIGTSTTGLSMAGTYTNGILFTGQVTLSNANRNASYFGIGTYATHITIDRSAQNASSRTYLMQMFADFAADTATTSDYAMGFYPKFSITTAAQTKSAFAVLSPTMDVDYNIKEARVLKAELDAAGANFTAVTNGMWAVSGFLDMGTETKNFDTSGALGSAAGIFGYDGGANLTLVGASRLFALMAHTYNDANATAVMLINAGGTVTDSALLVDEYEMVSCPIGIHISAGVKGLCIDHNTTTAIAVGSTILTNLFDFTGCGAAVLEDNLSAGTKAGSIVIKMPSGATAWINVYDGSRS